MGEKKAATLDQVPDLYCLSKRQAALARALTANRSHVKRGVPIHIENHLWSSVHLGHHVASVFLFSHPNRAKVCQDRCAVG